MVAQLTRFGLFGAALLLPALASANVFDKQKFPGHGQSIFKDDKHATSRDDVDFKRFRPATFVVRGEASIPRLADVANVELSMYITGPTIENVTADANESMTHVKDLLATLSASADAHTNPEASLPVEKWTASSVTARERIMFRRYGDRKDDDEEEKEFYANGHVTVRFRDFDLLRTVTQNITKSTKFTVNWINWQLSDQEKAAAQVELKKAAFRNALDAGHQYAEIFGVQLGTMLEFAETGDNAYADSDDDDFGMWAGSDYDDEDSKDWEPQTMKMRMDVTAKFSHNSGAVMWSS